MYVYVCVCMWKCVSMCARTCVCVRAHVCVRACVRVRARARACVFVRVRARARVCVGLCLCRDTRRTFHLQLLRTQRIPQAAEGPPVRVKDLPRVASAAFPNESAHMLRGVS